MRRQLAMFAAVLIGVAALPSGSLAQNGREGQPLPERTWLPVTVNTETFGSMVFVEEESIDRGSNVRSYVVVRVFRLIERGRRAYREHWKFDCNANSAWFDWVEVYDGNGRMTMTFTVPRERSETRDFPSGSVGGQMLKFACSDDTPEIDPIEESPLVFGPAFLEQQLKQDD